MACFICADIETANLCPLCQNLSVCTNHQNLHQTSNSCFPYKIDCHKYKGRILVATQNIPAGQVIFEETPLFSGPAKTSTPICLACLGPKIPQIKCKCSFPMCSKECVEKHQNLPECGILAENLPIFEDKLDYQAILPLRCLLAKNKSSKWEYLQMFEDHIQDRKLTSIWISDRQKIVQQIREKWKQNEFEEDEIFRVEGIIDINTLELLEPEFEHSEVSTPRAFYPLTSFCSHSCVNNTFRTLKNDGKGTLQTRAKMDIGQGEEITLHYAGGLKGRILRRTLLAEGWFFACRCKRFDFISFPEFF